VTESALGGVTAINRRQFIAGSLLLPAAVAASEESGSLYGLIVRMTAKQGQRDALVAILIAAVSAMPGCLSYVVALDSDDADAIWITEVWNSKESHDNSLSLPSVKEAIAKGRPMIAAMDHATSTTPIGGYGLSGAVR